MPLYKKNTENTLNSRVSLEKQKDRVPEGNYLVTRIFPPSKYPSATLCTPWFRVYVPKDGWLAIRQALSKDRESPFYLTWDGKNYEIEQDTNLVFGYKGYQKDDYGCRLEDTDMKDCFLNFEDFYGKVADAPETKPKAHNQDEQAEMPF